MVIGISRGPVSSGVLVALSLIATDYYTLTVGNQSAILLGWVLPVGLVLSAAFVGCLGFGYLCGKSYIDANSWRLWIYGIGWFIAISSGVFATYFINILTYVLFTASLILGGFGLAWYHFLTRNIEEDSLLLYVLFINTAINMVYVILEAVT